MGHGSTLNKIVNKEALYERAAARLKLYMKPIDTMRQQALTQAVYDDYYNYALPSDYDDLIDLIPQDDRNTWDNAFRNPAGQFDLQKAVRQRTVSIEANNGAKFVRINWRTRKGKVLNAMNSTTANGTWSAVGSATGVATDTIFKTSGSGSVKFTHVASGDGIKNTTMTAVDLTDENGVAGFLVSIYLSATPTSITAVWGNDLTTKYWTATPATTQADGTAFQIGWNIILVTWAAATQTGTVAPASIDSAQITLASTGALGTTRVDNLIFAIGRNFDIKYYSKYFFIQSDGTWASRPRTNNSDDLVLVDNDSLPHFLFECLKDMAQQMEGSDAAFDITYAEKELAKLYPVYKGRYPNQSKKQVSAYGGSPRYGVNFFKRFKR